MEDWRTNTEWRQTPCIIGGSARYHWIKDRGPIPSDLNVCHFCDNKRCRNLNHCFLATQAENLEDMERKGRAGWESCKWYRRLPKESINTTKEKEMHSNRIDELMKLKDLSNEEVCRLAGITQMTLWHAKQGKNVTLETMKKIAKALDEDMWFIWMEEAA